MMFVTLSVTDTAMSTQQIGQVGVHNRCIDEMNHVGPLEDGANNVEGHRCTYAVYNEGQYVGLVEHEQSEGALVLTRRVMQLVAG